MKLTILVSLTSLSLIGCEENLKQLDARRCKFLCYEKGNQAPVYEAACPHDPIVSVGEDSAKVIFFVKSRHFHDYGPFDKISKNLDKYDECVIDIRPKGRWH